jgi:hypothetical protein
MNSHGLAFLGALSHLIRHLGQTGRVAKSPKRPRLSRPERDALAQPLLNAVVGPAAAHPARAGLDVAPLIAALSTRALDHHLPEIAEIVNDRVAALQVVDELVAASKLHVGDKVRLGHNLRPNYFHGRAATIIAKDGERWVVRLDEAVTGKFANADLRVYARQLEPATGPE